MVPAATDMQIRFSVVVLSLSDPMELKPAMWNRVDWEGVVPECSDRRARESCALAGMLVEWFVEMSCEYQDELFRTVSKHFSSLV